MRTARPAAPGQLGSRHALLSVTVALGVGLGIALTAPPVAAKTAAAKPQAVSNPHLYGDYLAGRQAQQRRDFTNAAKFYEKALAADPDSPELISRTFLMEVFTGNFDRAAALARRELKRDPSDAVAHLVTVVERLKSGDTAGAAKEAAALPSDGVHRFIAPFALAWTRMAAGDLAGAETALQGLDKFNGFEPLKTFQLGLLYDFAGKPDKARQFYDKATAESDQLNWRVTEIVANFDELQGQPEQAKALYDRFLQQNSTSDLASAVAAIRAAGPAKPPLTSPADGLAAALFDLASILNQPESIDLALLYDRAALALRPQFPLARLLLSDILSAQKKPEESLAALGEIPKNSPYYWSAQLRGAINLDTLDRSDEAVVQLRTMAAENPTSIGPLVSLGDILRGKKRFGEAADAYDEAIRRTETAGLPEKWTLYYDRGFARERAGQWEKAEADLLKALELSPEQPMVLNYLGYSWIDR
ncbi:MAG: tetratricopeptide repeat protein, partial [Alphaproteobacteria bacterium]